MGREDKVRQVSACHALTVHAGEAPTAPPFHPKSITFRDEP